MPKFGNIKIVHSETFELRLIKMSEILQILNYGPEVRLFDFTHYYCFENAVFAVTLKRKVPYCFLHSF